MESIAADAVLYVDPQCPFAWITSEWLGEVEREGAAVVRRELMSLSCVNEGRELDAWYRSYNDEAWGAARVASALLAGEHAERWPEFYATYGRRRHVDRLRDNGSNLRRTVDELGLPAELLDAADRTDQDDDLRRRTRAAVEPSGRDGGTPMLHAAGRAYFGPVLTAVPRGKEAVRLWAGLRAVAASPQFAEIAGPRDDDALQTS
ncbi:mycothiol-dependent nitroreductase Rv2466c family protein [Angustibacter peucedani]